MPLEVELGLDSVLRLSASRSPRPPSALLHSPGFTASRRHYQTPSLTPVPPLTSSHLCLTLPVIPRRTLLCVFGSVPPPTEDSWRQGRAVLCVLTETGRALLLKVGHFPDEVKNAWLGGFLLYGGERFW